MKPAVYNEIDPYCCDVLRARIEDGLLPPGDVDQRDIREVSGDDYRGYGQIHLFAGIGGFGYAARLAGLPYGFDILTGGFPCQPWSVAGKRGGVSDDRHLWPEMLRLIREIRPERVLGENVPGLDDSQYMALDGVLSDLEGVGYKGWPVEIPACAVDAKHIRTRVWIVCYPDDTGEPVIAGDAEEVAVLPSHMADALKQGREGRTKAGDHERNGEESGDQQPAGRGGVSRCSWPPEPPVGRVVDGLPRRMDRLKSLGNAIVPQVAAEIMRAMKEATC